MLLIILILFTIGFNHGNRNLPAASLRVLLSEVFKTNVTNCNDLKIFSTNTKSNELNDANRTANVFQYVANLIKDRYNKSDRNKQFFGNKTESLNKHIFTIPTNLRSRKHNKTVISLMEQKQHKSECLLSSVINVVYNQFLTWQGKGYITSGALLQNLIKSGLQSGAGSLISVFFALTNLTNNFDKLLTNFDVLINTNLSTTTLIFINQFLGKAMEVTNAHKNDQVKSDQLKNRLALHKGDAITDSKLYPGLQTKLKQKERHTNFNKMLLGMDKTLKLKTNYVLRINKGQQTPLVDLVKIKTVETKKIPRVSFEAQKTKRHKRDIFDNVNYISVGRSTKVNTENEDNKTQLQSQRNERSQLVTKITEKMKKINVKNTHLIKFLSDVKQIINKDSSSEALLGFIDECLDQIRTKNKLEILPSIDNYVKKKFSTLKTFNKTVISHLQNKDMAEISAILDHHLDIDPCGITTLALDWLFEFRIQLLTTYNNENLFEMFESTYKKALTRQSFRQNVRAKLIGTNPKVSDIELTESEEFELALGK